MNIAKNIWKVWLPLHRIPKHLILLVFRVLFITQLRHKRDTLITASIAVSPLKNETE